MNAPIRRLAIVVAMMFCALLVSSTYIQFVAAKELNNRPDNRRTLLSSYARERGHPAPMGPKALPACVS